MILNRIRTNTVKKRGIFRYDFTKCSKTQQTADCSTQTKCYGQPTCHTHPHLVAPGEITPLITAKEFQERRQKVVENILANLNATNRQKKQIVVIPSATKQYMSDRIPYVFRQNTEFLYLSGCQEPDSCLILALDAPRASAKAVLFVREKDAYAETWDGPRTGPAEARGLFGVDEALSMSELAAFVGSGREREAAVLWYDFMSPVQNTVHKIMEDYLKSASSKLSLSPKAFIQDVRKIKSPAEIRLMQKSCDIASEAIAKCMAHSKPGVSEHELFATVDYECRMSGAEMLAYPPVIAGGSRATTIHYINNNQIVHDGEMVLMDAGCEYHGYSSDITRTWPVSGRFSPAQLDLYNLVLDVQRDVIEMCRQRPPLDRLFDVMCTLLARKLKEVRLVPEGSVNVDQLVQAAYQFCPHHVSHYLGMDVHDTPTVAKNTELLPGMIITVEPGIYINDSLNVRPEFKGLGIRIEDDILITEDGPVVLTKNCPKIPSDIESLISKQSR